MGKLIEFYLAIKSIHLNQYLYTQVNIIIIMRNGQGSLFRFQKIQYLCLIPLISICVPFGLNTEAQAQNSVSLNNTSSVKDERINLAIENLRVERSVTNLVETKGEIRNNSTEDVHELKISAEYFDTTGTLLKEVEHFVTSPARILKPGELIYFDILEVIGFHNLGNYKIGAIAEPVVN